MCKKCGKKGCGCNFKQPKRFDDIPDLTRSTQFYSQVYDIAEPSGNWKFDLGAVNDFVGLKVNNVDLGYIPMLTGNVSNLNEYVTDIAGDQWIIDVLGNAKKLAGGGGSGTVTNITAGSGMDFAAISASGAVTMGTPSSITLSSTNGFPSSTTHTHEFAPGGTSGQYIAGNGTLVTFPTIPAQVNIIAGTGIGITGSYPNITVTNSLPSKWSISSFYIQPTGSYDIRAYSNNTTGWAVMSRGSGSTSGNIAFYSHTQALIGFVGNNSSFLQYDASIGYHRFTTGSVRIDNVPNDNALTNIAVFDTGTNEIKYRTVASLGIPNYTAGTGISIASNIITNTLPSKWTAGTSTNIYRNSFVGIGNIPTPLWELHIYSTASSVAQAIDCDNTAVGSAQLIVRTNGTGGRLWFFQTGNNGSTLNGRFRIVDDTGGAERYTILPTGYTGISKAAPTSTLHVGGDLAIDSISNNNALTNILMSTGTGSGVVNYRTVASLPFTNNTGTVTNFSAQDLNAGTYDLFSVNVTNPTTIPDLTFSLPTLPQKMVFAAPWGASGTPFWRQLQTSDLQQNGATLGQVVTWDGTAWTAQNPTGGGVTNVGLALPVSTFAISGSPVTSTGTLTGAFISQAQRNVLAAPNGSGGTPTWRQLVVSDLGQSGATTGEVMGWNGTVWAPSSNLASKWTISGAYIQPTALASDIRAFVNTSTGWAVMSRGSGSSAGNIAFYSSGQSLIGYVGNQNTYIEYNTSIGNHRFTGGTVQISNIPTAASSTDIMVVGASGVVSQRPLSGISVGNDVWFDQTTGVAATNNGQHIARAGRVRIGATGSSGYMLSVVGDAYISGGVIVNNNTSYAGFSTSAVATTIARIDTSNRVQLAQTGTNIILPSYPNTRDDASVPTNYLYTDSAGVLQSSPASDLTGSFRSVTLSSVNITTTSTALATSTSTVANIGSIVTLSGNNAVIPTGSRYWRIDLDLDWSTTSVSAGAINIELICRVGGTIVEQGTKTITRASDIRGNYHFHWITQLTGAVTVSARYISPAVASTLSSIRLTTRYYGFAPA